MSKKMYIVENGNYVQGYYRKAKNAGREKERANKLALKLKRNGNKNVDTATYVVNYFVTSD
ncbi:hypothetical protein [Shouchella miscanthi]|uniref:hypothetical protein n=1 Tax=Shouchella miscanthi TaxID=2598861 RepID=UPI0011A804D5|nr:hypothetical protein [Shouchella miscanthi]